MLAEGLVVAELIAPDVVLVAALGGLNDASFISKFG